MSDKEKLEAFINTGIKADAYIFDRQYGSGLTFVEPLKPANYDETENGEFKVIPLFSEAKVNALLSELKILWHSDYIEKVAQINQLNVDLKNTKDDLSYFRNELSALKAKYEVLTETSVKREAPKF